LKPEHDLSLRGFEADGCVDPEHWPMEFWQIVCAVPHSLTEIGKRLQAAMRPVSAGLAVDVSLFQHL
jgi:hypothetical protein